MMAAYKSPLSVSPIFFRSFSLQIPAMQKLSPSFTMTYPPTTSSLTLLLITSRESWPGIGNAFPCNYSKKFLKSRNCSKDPRSWNPILARRYQTRCHHLSQARTLCTRRNGRLSSRCFYDTFFIMRQEAIQNTGRANVCSKIELIRWTSGRRFS